MSIKIYNGFKINSNNIEDLFDFKSNLRHKLLDKSYKKVKKNFVKEFCSLRDHRVYFSNINNIEVSNQIYDILIKEYKDFLSSMNEYSYFRNPDYDAALKIHIYKGKSGILGIYNSEDSFDYHKDIFNFPIIEDYMYQNQTDKPENISEEDWDFRKEDWLYALNNEICVLNIIDRYDLLNIETELKNKNKFESEFIVYQEEIYQERLELAAIDIISKEIYEQKYNDNKNSSFMKSYREARESKEEIDKKIEYLRNISLVSYSLI